MNNETNTKAEVSEYDQLYDVETLENVPLRARSCVATLRDEFINLVVIYGCDEAKAILNTAVKSVTK